MKIKLLIPSAFVHLLAASHAFAATGTWTGASGATWDTSATNWSGVSGTPWDSNNGFSNTALITPNGSYNVSGTVYANGLTYSTGANASITGGNLTVGSADGTSPIINIGDGTSNPNFYVYSTLSGTNGFIKIGTGQFQIVNNSTISGTIQARQGFLNFYKGGSGGSMGTASLVIGDNTASPITGTITVNLDQNSGQTYANAITFVANGQTQTKTLQSRVTNATVSGPITITNNAILTAAAACTLTIDGGIVGSSTTSTGVTLANTANGTVILNGSNSYTGNTTLGSGTLKLGNANALASTTFKGGTGTLSFGSLTAANFGGLASSTALALSNDSSAAVALTVGGNGDSTTTSGTISGSGSLTKTGAGTLTLTGSNSYTGATTVENGKLALDGGTNRLATSGTVTLGAASTSGKLVLGGTSTANQTLAGLLTTGNGGSVVGGNASNSTLTLNIASGTNSFSGTLGGAGTNENNLALTKQGTGTLTLSASNSYAGATTISAGVVSISNNNALGATGAGSATTVANGAALQLNNVSIGESLTLTGQGVSSSGVLRAMSGTNSVGGTVGISGATRIGVESGASLAFNGAVSGNSYLILNPKGSSSLTFSGTLTNNGTTIVHDTTGTVVLGAANNRVGEYQLKWGTLRTDVANALDPSTTILQMSSGSQSAGDGGGPLFATFNLNGNSQTISRLYEVSTGSPANSLITSASAATLTISGTANSSYSGQITGALALTKSGSGALTLSGNNTYTGATTVNGGDLNVTNGLASGGALALGASATANLSNSGQTLGAVSNNNTATNALNFSAATGTVTLASLSGAGNTRFGSNAIITGGIGEGTVNAIGSLTANITGGTTTVGGVATIGTMSAGTANLNGATSSITTLSGGNIALGSSTVLSVSGGSSSGIISGGGGLTKTGVGSLELLGANSYTGTTTVSEGTLAVNGSLAGGVTVINGATLQGNGTISGATTIGGSLKPGNSPGLLTFANSVTLQSTATTTMEIVGNSTLSRGVTYDAIDVAGALVYDGTLTLNFSGPAYGEGVYNFNLFDFASQTGGFTSMSLAGLYSGALINNAGVWGYQQGDNTWSFNQGDGALTFTVVPEPNVAMVVGSLALMTLLRRRRD